MLAFRRVAGFIPHTVESLHGIDRRHSVTAPLANLLRIPADAPLEKLLRVAFTRWNVEHTFRVAKSEIGFGHFEGRSYVALMRHMILCLIVMGFVAEHTDRLRGEKTGDHDGASVPSSEPALPDLAEESPRDNRSRTHGRGHRLSPAA